jgi:hypothetical protein
VSPLENRSRVHTRSKGVHLAKANFQLCGRCSTVIGAIYDVPISALWWRILSGRAELAKWLEQPGSTLVNSRDCTTAKSWEPIKALPLKRAAPRPLE